MPLVECKSGRVYLLELGTIILEQMSPSVVDELTPEMLEKMQKIGEELGPEKLEQMSELDVIVRLGLDKDELQRLKNRIKDAEMGPTQLKKCLRKVDGKDPGDLENPFNDDEPYGSTEEFIDRDETLVEDLATLTAIIVEKLEAYNLGMMKQGESEPSSKKRGMKKS